MSVQILKRLALDLMIKHKISIQTEFIPRIIAAWAGASGNFVSSFELDPKDNKKFNFNFEWFDKSEIDKIKTYLQAKCGAVEFTTKPGKSYYDKNIETLSVSAEMFKQNLAPLLYINLHQLETMQPSALQPYIDQTYRLKYLSWKQGHTPIEHLRSDAYELYFVITDGGVLENSKNATEIREILFLISLQIRDKDIEERFTKFVTEGDLNPNLKSNLISLIKKFGPSYYLYEDNEQKLNALKAEEKPAIIDKQPEVKEQKRIDSRADGKVAGIVNSLEKLQKDLHSRRRFRATLFIRPVVNPSEKFQQLKSKFEVRDSTHSKRR